MNLDRCPGCGGLTDSLAGPTHAYMISSPGCWSRYGEVLAAEYGNPELLPTHRLSVDAYAAQHPGDPGDRRAIQSTGLHLARLMLQLERPTPPRETNEVMLGLGRSKASLPHLRPPRRFVTTVTDVPLNAGHDAHASAVRAWAIDTWKAWADHHAFIRTWTLAALAR